MKRAIYNINYSNENLSIPSEIWNNDNIKGMAKMLLALYKKLTKDGTEPIKNMTIRQAQICATRVKDIDYNQKQLVKLGAIKITNDVVMGQMLEYTYMLNESEEVQQDNSLF